MNIVGIDFSIKFPSACITDNFNTFKFVSLVNTKNIPKIHKEFLLDVKKNLSDFDIEFLDGMEKEDEYYLKERQKLLNYKRLSENFINLIIKHNGESAFVSEPLFAIEGTSYNSKGSYAFELPAASMVFKREAFEKILNSNINHYFVFPPANLKQAIGCKGNAKKDVIFLKFLDEPGIKAIEDTEFYKFLKDNVNNPRVFNSKTGKVESPFNDLIDAYLAVLSLYNIKNS